MSITLTKPAATHLKIYRCPSWCVVDHGDVEPEDVFHRSNVIALVPPRDCYGSRDVIPQMRAHLVSYERPDEYGQPCISVDLDDRMESYTELDVAEADNMIRQMEAYTAQLRVWRDQLATLTR